jgi:hypothetical protein
VIIKIIDEKKGTTLYSINHRKSKAIKIFLIHCIKEKWVTKSDVMNIVWNTMQFENIWEFFKSKKKIEDDEDGD